MKDCLLEEPPKTTGQWPAHWQLALHVWVAALPGQVCIVPGVQPWLKHVALQSDQTPLLHVRCSKPQLPHACVEPGGLQAHWPLRHVEPAAAGQTFPHAPQLPLFVCSSTQTPPHIVYPILQVVAQTPLPLQLAPAFGSDVAHALPQLPQLALSVFSLTHAPLHSV
jgi:hypothetical protein